MIFGRSSLMVFFPLPSAQALRFQTALALFEIREQPIVRIPLSCMCMFKAIGNPDFDHRLPGDAEAFSLSVK